MQARILTFHADMETGCFDDQALQEHLDGRDLLSLSDHFYLDRGRPTLVLVVTSRPSPTPRASRTCQDLPRPDPAAGLSADERRLFEALRRWRNDRANRDGRPTCVLLTNAQIVDIARARPTSLAALQRIPGVGDGKVASFGQDLVAFIESFPPREPDAP